MPALIWKTGLDRGPVLVASGRVFDDRGDVAAASGSQVFLFVPDEGEYRLFARLDLAAGVTALAAGRPGLIREDRAFYVASTAERIFIIGLRQGAAAVLAATGPEAGAGFSDVAAGDLDGDGREEIVAAASATGTIYVYRLTGEGPEVAGIELVGIRLVPGTLRFVEVLARPGLVPAVAVAFEQDGRSGLALFTLTERGFQAGPVLDGLPFRITGLSAGEFTARPGTELALGGAGGTVWLVGNWQGVEVLLVTDSLGTSVSALASSPAGPARLLAGTPEGNVFGFSYPVDRSPDLAFSLTEGVSSLAAVPGERAAVGTALGGVQVWSLGGDPAGRYVVRPGDTLWKIAGRFGVSVDQILSVNVNIKNPNVIIPGQIIIIPARRPTP